jgi:hypothetical protein
MEKCLGSGQGPNWAVEPLVVAVDFEKCLCIPVFRNLLQCRN